MRKFVGIAAAVSTLSLLALSEPASAEKLSGEYLVTLTDNHGSNVPFCFSFTNTGQISGYANSGYWTTTQQDVDGDFVVDHGQLRFYGSYYSISNFISGEAKLRSGKGGWVTFGYPLAPGGSGDLTIAQGC